MNLQRCLQKVKTPSKILVVKMSAIGDVVQSLPALNALKWHFPKARIDWLVEDKAMDIVREHPAIERLIVFYRKEKKMYRCIRSLRQDFYDWAIDLQGTFKSALFMRLSRSRWRIGYDQNREPCGFLYNTKVSLKTWDQLPVVKHLGLLEQLGVPRGRIAYSLSIMQNDVDIVDRILKEESVDGQYLLVNASATRKANLWGIDKFRSLIQKLRQYCCKQIIILGGYADRKRHQKLCQGLDGDGVIDLTGRLTLKQSAYVMKKAVLLIAGDTGPLHLAVAVGCPVMGLYGPTNPLRTGPFQEEAVIVQWPVKCQPCYKKKCPLVHHKCMKDLSVDYVLKQLIPFWKQNQRRK